MILIFEGLGTGLVTSLYLSSTTYSGVDLSGNGFSFLIGFFILLILSARISGSHYNPCVTLAFMLRKDAG